ncbi:MAG: amidase domain-containing protein [Clostridia bacterium]|nr:amidase domain-containing protein [Clostridia bacterium]
MKKTILLVLILAIISCCFLPSVADNSLNAELDTLTVEENAVFSLVSDFLSKKAKNEWIYTDYDLSLYFAPMAALSRANQNLIDITEVRREYHKEVGKIKKDFTTDYMIQSIAVSEDVAEIEVYETIGYFIVNGNGEPTKSSEVYRIRLEKQDRWYITDIEIPYDALYSEVKFKSFDKNEYLSKSIKNLNGLRSRAVSYETVMLAESEDLGQNADGQRGAVNSITNAYNPAQAAAYASIYSYEYNSNEFGGVFYDTTDRGGDCANFGSQCIWAGFGGDLTRAGGSSTSYPFDYSGIAGAVDPTVSTCWNQQYSGTGNGGSNWFLSQWLYDYAVNSSNLPNEHGWKAIYGTAWNSEAEENIFPSTHSYHGAVFFVQGRGTGSGAQYGHTIFIYKANGNNPDNMYYCAHTTDAQNECLGDNDVYINNPIRYIIPTEYKIQTNCSGTYTTHFYPTVSSGYSAVCSRCGYVNMYMNLGWGHYYSGQSNAVQIKVSEIRSNRCYEIYVEVKKGDNLVDSFTATNSSSLSCISNNMTEDGLYTISVQVKDKPNGIVRNYKYTIRVGGRV